MSDLEITRGTSNVSADLGYPDAAERQIISGEGLPLAP
jgi:hypothetical protein